MTPIVIEQFKSMGTRWEPEKVPSNLAIRVRNCIYAGDSIKLRGGLTEAFKGSVPTAQILGLGEFTPADGTRRTMFQDSLGNLFMEAPEIGVTPVDIDPAKAGMSMDMAAAYNRSYMAFSDLQTATATPLVFYFDVASGQFRLETVGLAPNAVPAGAAAPSASAGDVDQGIRYVIVMFETPTGYISGWTLDAVLVENQNVADKSVDVTIPVLGPAFATKRVVAFTQAGASSEGPYFAILEGTTIEGLNAPITSTVIDNTGTGAFTFNFTDAFLIGATDVTSFIDKILLPPQKSVCYSKTLQRLIWAGENASVFRVSEADDPETYMGSTGFCQPGFGDDGTAIRAIEFKTETFLVKDNGGFSVSDSTLTPSEWVVPRRWAKSGPMGPWAIDASDQFMAWAHRSGPYVYLGADPIWIGYEISGNSKNFPNWDRINWRYGHLIYLTIDSETKTIRIGVPMDLSNQINVELVCDYSQGIANRRWSWSDIAANRAVRVKRRQPDSPNPGTPTDNQISTTQLLYAMGTSTGSVAMEDPGSPQDQGGGILQEFQIGYTPIQKVPGIYQLQAIDFTVSGQGQLEVTVYPRKSDPIKLDDIELEEESADHLVKLDSQNERWSVLVSNKGDVGNYFVLHRIILWVVKIWDTRVI